MTPLPGQITAQDLADFIAAQGFTTFASLNGHLPSQPDELVIITGYGGSGFNSDGAFDQVSFQLRVRGPQADELTAEQLAWTIDGMLVPPPGSPPLLPGKIGSQWVQRIERNSAPAFLTRDSSRRTHYVCNYSLHVSRVATA